MAFETKTSEEPSIHVYNMGTLGHLARVEMPVHSVGPKSTVLPGFIAVVDRSGSMGHTCSDIVNFVLPQVLSSLGYPQDYVMDLITFDSIVETFRVAVKHLRCCNASCRGSTAFSGTLVKIHDLLMAEPERPFRIVVLSDGEVDDRNAVLYEAARLQSVIRSRPGPVYVNLQRVMTNTFGSPCTKSLACVGSWATCGAVAVTDTKVQYVPQKEVVQILGTQIVEGLTAASHTWTVMSHGVAAFQRLPTDTAMDQVVLPPGVTYLILPPQVDINTLQLSVNGVPLRTITKSLLRDEAEMGDLLSYVETQMRMLAVSGACPEHLQGLLAWIRQVQTLITSRTDAPSAFDIKDRMQYMLSLLRSQERSTLARLAQLENLDQVARLNSQQQAEYLRTVPDTSAGRALARRSNQRMGDVDVEEVVQAEFKALTLEHFLPVAKQKSEVDLPVSFYSTCHAQDTIEALKDVLSHMDDVEKLSVHDLLQVVGCVGIAYRSDDFNPLPDPWRARVDQVHFDCLLSEADLLMAFRQGSGTALCTPGTKQPITGVDPIRCLQPRQYDFLQRHFRQSMALQASISLRGVVALIPGDVLARKAAVTMKILETLAEQAGMVCLTVLDVCIFTRQWCRTSFGGTIEVSGMGIEGFAFHAIDLGQTNVFTIGTRFATGGCRSLLVWRSRFIQFVEAFSGVVGG